MYMLERGSTERKGFDGGVSGVQFRTAVIVGFAHSFEVCVGAAARGSSGAHIITRYQTVRGILSHYLTRP